MLRNVAQGLCRLSVNASAKKLPACAGCTNTVLKRGFADDSSLKKTPLYDLHVEHGAKMVPFAGYSMPIQYKDSIMDSTINCRKNGSLFDVSHMCGLSLKGKDAIPFLEKLVVGDIAGLKDNSGSLSVFTNEKGGIIDDTVVTKVNDKWLYLVVNAGCRDKDLEWIEGHLAKEKAAGKDVSIHIHDEKSLLAVQGPLAAPAVQSLMKGVDLSKMYFSDFGVLKINGVECYLTRTGYTGEDGFEISVPNEAAVSLTNAILEAESQIRLTGLGARDSLRLEAGLCLYGNDLDEDTTPIEAGLTWTVGKRRRSEGGFMGSETILQQIKDGPTRRRVGFVASGAPARHHCKMLSSDGEVIGEVSSGGFSPNLKQNIGMGYVATGHHKAGTKIKVEVRGRVNEGTVTKMPFVPAHYYKPPK
ncbi:glycine cleavage T-protein family [Klebsormidium nitens]|uniref:Aminomethyltransferase n=1 Tax=Klebsormidium nitens TaxID=105231 RepID=A0A1Y1I8R6_KLENI|nr:glycine cleavage T-protein family [Klebsormidium nitens]|eukprot:GAQ84488.1 glycine cleavage T-protein family [Klebsormidium nitens]